MTHLSKLARAVLLAALAWLQCSNTALAGAPLTDAQLVTALRGHLQQLAAQDAFSGSVLVAKNGKVLFEQAYGSADHAFNAPNKVDTKFNLGSMGKMFTAVSVLQLAQQGRLSLDDTVLKLVPDYPDKDIAAKVTVYQLLTHTAGFGPLFGPKFADTPKEKLTTIESHLPLFVGKPLQFEPGTQWAYSNEGYIVLGLIIERVSGQSYDDYVREHVFKPAGMINTDNYQPHDDVPNLAIGYMVAATQSGRTLRFPGGLAPAGKRITNRDFVQPGASAGGGYSTVEDLLRFAQALQGYKLLNKEFTDLQMTGKVATGRGTAKYGFGMTEDFINGVRVAGHGGGGPGINSNLDMFPASGYVVAIMCNYDSIADVVKDRIRAWLTGLPLPQAVHLPADSLKALAGTYNWVLPAGGLPGPRGPRGDGSAAAASPPPPPMEPVQISADAQGLWLSNGDRHRLLPLSATEFFDDNAPALHFQFTRDGTGAVTGFTFPGPGPGAPPMKAARQ